MRNMSFMLTTPQMYARTKTVTRRFGWWFLQPGDVVMACEKCQGLKKGERVKKIHPIRILSTRREQADSIVDADPAELAREGFPEMDRWDFLALLLHANRGASSTDLVNRIEFEHLEVE